MVKINKEKVESGGFGPKSDTKTEYKIEDKKQGCSTLLVSDQVLPINSSKGLEIDPKLDKNPVKNSVEVGPKFDLPGIIGGD